MKLRLLLLLLISLGAGSGWAQNQDSVIPDLTGLNVPQAMATLNQAGFALGTEQSVLWTADLGVPENTITAQSIAPQSASAPGTAVNVTVARTPNITLIYDDNDFTLINRAGTRIELTGLAFSTLDSSTAATFDATRWGGRLRGDYCTQVWSVGRNEPKPIDGCRSISWLTTNNPAEHFWTAANGVRTFNVTQDGVERAICNAAPPNSQDSPTTCAFFVEAGGQGGFVPYIYLAYTTDQLVIINRSTDQWMYLNGTTIWNQHPNRAVLGDSFIPGRPRLYTERLEVARTQRIAPGQCVRFKLSGMTGDELPEACFVVATLELPVDQLFWASNFEIQGLDMVRRLCRAATADKLTICVMPR
ncbi:MAG: PASTA domain-containing protein [Anaerolineae bacterium]|nr:PASTA domain-containing protein [Anaerolineae bacterium]